MKQDAVKGQIPFFDEARVFHTFARNRKIA
jgi:hypothetical protein